VINLLKSKTQERPACPIEQYQGTRGVYEDRFHSSTLIPDPHVLNVAAFQDSSLIIKHPSIPLNLTLSFSSQHPPRYKATQGDSPSLSRHLMSITRQDVTLFLGV
jgi:hypothetical protein